MILAHIALAVAAFTFAAACIGLSIAYYTKPIAETTKSTTTMPTAGPWFYDPETGAVLTGAKLPVAWVSRGVIEQADANGRAIAALPRLIETMIWTRRALEHLQVGDEAAVNNKICAALALAGIEP